MHLASLHLCMHLASLLLVFHSKITSGCLFYPLCMNNLYIYQIYILILSEPSDSLKTVQTHITFWRCPISTLQCFTNEIS